MQWSVVGRFNLVFRCLSPDHNHSCLLKIWFRCRLCCGWQVVVPRTLRAACQGFFLFWKKVQHPNSCRVCSFLRFFSRIVAGKASSIVVASEIRSINKTLWIMLISTVIVCFFTCITLNGPSFFTNNFLEGYYVTMLVLSFLRWSGLSTYIMSPTWNTGNWFVWLQKYSAYYSWAFVAFTSTFVRTCRRFLVILNFISVEDTEL